MKTNNFLELKLIQKGKIEHVAVYVYNNKLEDENLREFIRRVYKDLSESRFDSRNTDIGYTFLMYYIKLHGLGADVIEEIIAAAKTKNDYQDLVTKSDLLYELLYACVNLNKVSPELYEKISVLSQMGIIPEIPLITEKDRAEYVKACNKVTKYVIGLIGITLFE